MITLFLSLFPPTLRTHMGLKTDVKPFSSSSAVCVVLAHCTWLCLDIGDEKDRYETGGHVQICTHLQRSTSQCMKHLVLNASSFCPSHSKYLHVKSSVQILARKLLEAVNVPLLLSKERPKNAQPYFQSFCVSLSFSLSLKHTVSFSKQDPIRWS